MHDNAVCAPLRPKLGKNAGPCRHCGATNTPQWREGPAQKEVLCNACGLRFKRVGHLVEYRPRMRRRVDNLVKPVPIRAGFFMPPAPPTDIGLSRRKRFKPTCTC